MPVSLGQLDEFGNLKMPFLFDGKLKDLMDDKYHQDKYLKKTCKGDSFNQGTPSAARGGPTPAKQFKMDRDDSSPSFSQTGFRCRRGSNRGGARGLSRGSGKKHF